MIYTPQQLRDEAEKEAEYFPWSGPQARAAKDRAHAAALEELAAANRQLDDCEHGYATLKADLAAANAWKEAVIDELIVDHIYTKEHETNPRKAIQDAITWNCQVALDPAVSSDARALIAANTKLVAKPDVAGLVERVNIRRGADQMRKLRGERPQDEPWPWIHEEELLSTLLSLSAQLAEKEADYTRLQNEYANSIDAWTAGLQEKEAECDGLRGLLMELHAMVKGECSSLLDEDKGGNAALDAAIDAAIAAREKP